ncbi:hypothetical protein CW304_01960 [Bacillus sp. UFRGS-B20]|nr:hypothetical protein CW304_01960 [Bacillus sp. UFRGS-B20]
MVRVLKKTEKGPYHCWLKVSLTTETLPIKPRVSPCNDDFIVISYFPDTQFYTLTLKISEAFNIFYSIPSVKTKNV